ncbi:MAG: tRNA (guanosine(46)-N7)-methyltransferase TrmB [Lachnospiraceae bacterium]|nr:tRNA (guanosine(46)-N7)-methyltransferase TrmB [Lachnospiraceae bacterium]
MRLRNIPQAKEIIQNSPYVIKDPFLRRNHWKDERKAPLFAEIGMGKGSFIMELAARHPENEYLGVERYDSVLFRAAEKMEGKLPADPAGKLLYEERRESVFEPPKNLHFLNRDAKELPDMFGPGEIDGLYLNFSDPWPKARHAKRRLTSKEFLKVYEKVLKDGGSLEFKTDNMPLFEFSLEEIRDADCWELVSYTYDLHQDPVMNEGNIMTEYERKFSALGSRIGKLIAVYRKGGK